jgi:aryl-alcohol dehydrogenase-like predicted oxidoreductase
MKIDAIDLIQLHCAPTETYERPEIFELFANLKQEGKIRHFGVSVERVEEALRAIQYDNVATVQIIFNMFRQRPAEEFFVAAKKKNIGIIARVPMASGLLSGKFSSDTQFGKEDHRTFNRNGEAFDKGETFSGIPFEKGLAAVEELKKLFPEDTNLAAIALRWILMFKVVSCVIPGASNPDQVLSNISASGVPELSQDQLEKIKAIYDQYIWSDLQKEKW